MNRRSFIGCVLSVLAAPLSLFGRSKPVYGPLPLKPAHTEYVLLDAPLKHQIDLYMMGYQRYLNLEHGIIMKPPEQLQVTARTEVDAT